MSGVDGSRTAIERAVSRLSKECPGWDADGELLVGDMTSLSFSDALFDAVIDNEAIYSNSVEDSIKIYAELARILKPGGKLFSRMFATETWGYGTGQQVAYNTFIVSEGPMQGKGLSRFTAEKDIPLLTGSRFELDPLEWVQRSVEGGRHVIKEWIVTGTKHA